jgi:hypothetical protein
MLDFHNRFIVFGPSQFRDWRLIDTRPGVADTPGRGVAPSGSLQPHGISDNFTCAEVRLSESAGAQTK